MSQHLIMTWMPADPLSSLPRYTAAMLEIMPGNPHAMIHSSYWGCIQAISLYSAESPSI